MANVYSYLFNSTFTFRARGSYRRFFFISVLTLLLSFFTYYGLNVFFNPHNDILLANVLKVSTIAISLVTNYFGYKLLVFRV